MVEQLGAAPQPARALDAGSSVESAADRPQVPRRSLFRTIVETSPYLYAVADEQLRFTYVNPAFEAVLGYSPDDLLGRSAIDIIDPDDFELAIGALAQLVDEIDRRPDEGIPMAVRLVRQDGVRTPVEVGAVPHFDHPDVRGVILRGRPLPEQPALDGALDRLMASSAPASALDYVVASIEHEFADARAALSHHWDLSKFGATITTHSSTAPAALDSTLVGLLPSIGSPWEQALACCDLVAVDAERLPQALQEHARACGLMACWAMPILPPSGSPHACLIVWRAIAGDPFVSHRVTLDRASHLATLALDHAAALDGSDQSDQPDPSDEDERAGR